MAAREKPHYAGHRQRLRARFLAAGGEALPDYELLELLLFLAQPRADMKPVAKRLLAQFGGFADVISAEPARLAEVEGVGQAAIGAIKLAQASALRLLRDEATGSHVIGSWDAVLDYCRASMGREKTEQFRILFLDNQNHLIKDEVQSRGTVNHTPLYPREVIKRALDLGASAIVMVHNHPSGDATPSAADVEMTKEVVEAGRKLGIAVHDHVIITRGGHTSFKTLGLI